MIYVFFFGHMINDPWVKRLKTINKTQLCYLNCGGLPECVALLRLAQLVGRPHKLT